VDAEELSRFDGKEGRPAYIAYKGVVYDVTDNPMWEGGSHMDRVEAGRDLTEFLQDAPHGEEVFDSLDIIGKLETTPSIPKEETHKKTESSCKTALKAWYKRYHPHPMTVHFPIALHFFAGGMDLLFLYSPSKAYEVAVFYSFFVATVMGLVAMVPGLLSWWVNYNLSMARPFAVKLYVALFTLIVGFIGIALYLEEPGVAYGVSLESCLYHGIIFVTVLSVIVLGYFGGKISWSGR